MSIQVDSDKLVYDRYYENLLDYLQDVCEKAGVLPCVFDAAAFDNDNAMATQGSGRNSACLGRNA